MASLLASSPSLSSLSAYDSLANKRAHWRSLRSVLGKPPGKISLLEIIEAVDPLRRPKSWTVATLATLEKTMVAARAMLREPLAATALADVASIKKETRRSAKK